VERREEWRNGHRLKRQTKSETIVTSADERRNGMRRVVLFALTLLVALAFTSVASATGENKNTVTFTINCGEFGTFTGSLPGGAGGALHLEGGGVAIAQGLATLGGTLIDEPTPGLEKQGKLVPCRFTFPGQPELIAFALFAPANP
jgi:hypothetical protein